MNSTQEIDRPASSVRSALLAFAVFLVIAGGSLAVVQRRGDLADVQGASGHIRQSTDGSRLEMVACMGRAEYRSTTSTLRHAELVTVAGQSALDFSQARMAGDRGELQVFVMGGRAQVKVPPNWEVVTSDSLAVGALLNRARHAQAEPVRTLRLEAVVLGGMLEVTH